MQEEAAIQFDRELAMQQFSVFPAAQTKADIARNVETVRARIFLACERSGRDAAGIRLLPVSKTVEESRIRLAYDAGLRVFGENKAQEANWKERATSDLQGMNWSIIGHLQTNKAKLLARFASEFQALDSVRVAEALDRRLQTEGRSLDVFVQVNTSGESSKYGLEPDKVTAFVKLLPAFSGLRVRGLMTLAIFTDDRERVRKCFTSLRRVQERIRNDVPNGEMFAGLSMGMSGDFEVAIEEGATVVRVGQAIFGARMLPDSHYWPASTTESEI